MTFVDDNNNVLEFDGEFAMTKQAVSFFNGQIKGDVSETFQVDNNSVNRDVLGYYGPQMTSQVAWTKQAFNRMRNGNVIDRGYIVIQNGDSKRLNCFYVSGNSNWIQLVTGLITELDFSGVTGGNYLTQLTSANVASLRTATSGVIFPMVDWCYDLNKGNNEWFCADILDGRNDTDLTYFEWYPCFYLHTLMSEIARQKGLKFDGDVFDNQIYKTIILPPFNGEIKRDRINLTTASGYAGYSNATTVYTQYTQLTETSDPEGLFITPVYTANKSSKVIITVVVVDSSISGTALGHLAVRKNGSPVQEFTALTVFQDQYTVETTAVSGDTFDIALKRTLFAGTVTATLNLKVEIPTVISVDDYFTPDLFLPEFSCLDIIKFVINLFGCQVTFNEFSKTITMNILENMKPENADDWSEYLTSLKYNYTIQSAQNNYLRLVESEDTDIKAYNKANMVKYGEGNIQTTNTLKKDRDIFTIPFAASEFGLSKNGNWMTNIPLVRLTDVGDPVSYSSISDDGSGNAVYNFATGPVFVVGQVVRVVDTSSGDMGYFIIESVASTNIKLYGLDFTYTSTGRIYQQERSFNEVSPRFLICKQGTSISDFALATSYNLHDNLLSPTNYTTTPFATFCKSKTGYNIDLYKGNLAFDNPGIATFVDPTIKQLFLNKISKLLGNPDMIGIFTLPESVYQKLNFDRFIYLKSEDFTGYVFVSSVSAYIDSNTPVEVNLYML